MRWIGGTPESIGQESAQWGEEVKGKVQEAGKETQSAQGSMEKTMGGIGMKAVGKVKGALGKAVGGGGDTSGKVYKMVERPEVVVVVALVPKILDHLLAQ